MHHPDGTTWMCFDRMKLKGRNRENMRELLFLLQLMGRLLQVFTMPSSRMTLMMCIHVDIHVYCILYT